jgi:HEPN domain-containing protein
MLGFHSQRAVEKRIKSVLAIRGVAFERTHNIAYLLRLLADRGIEPPADADRVSALTPWATGFRCEDVPEQSLDRPMVRRVVDAVSRWAQEMGIREATCE